MGFFSRLTKKNLERVLVLHIGSASVVGALVSIENDISTVTGTAKSDIAVHADVSLSKFEASMEKALEETLASFSEKHVPSPDRIVVYLASPWYASQVRVAKVARPASFVVSRAFVNDMISRELKTFEDEELAQSKESGASLRAIESKILQAKLNGYPTAEPIGQGAHELDLSLFLSVAPERTLARVEEIVAHAYHRPVSFATFLSAAFLIARDFFPHEDDYLLIDIGGEVTDVTMVRESTIIQTVSFPYGRNFILRKLATGLKRSIPEALSICTLYTEGKVEDKVKDSCTRILGEAKDEWLDTFQKTLFATSNELSLPSTILLSVEADVAPWFIETIRREKFHQYALAEKDFKMVVLDATLFHESLVFTEGAERLPCIMIEALAIART